MADSLLEYWSQSAASRMSASLIVPFELEYMNRLQCIGWNSAAVMTSVSSSMFTGLMSTISAAVSFRFSTRCDDCAQYRQSSEAY
jgi:hypothetical protein